MIPVLAVPVLDQYELLADMEKSVDADVRRYFVIDNGDRYEGTQADLAVRAEKTHVCRPGANLGWGASINLAIKANIHAPWWLFANDDIIFAPGDLDRVAERMWQAAGPTLATMQNCGFSAFAINDAMVEAVGWFDESYHPAYCEDCDYEWRARRKGFLPIIVEGSTRHLGSQTIGKSLPRRNSNNLTYPVNVKYHQAKWGGEPRQEVYETPFNQGGDPSITPAPRLSRLRELAW